MKCFPDRRISCKTEYISAGLVKMTKMTYTVCGLPCLTLGGKAAPSFAFFITYKYMHKLKHAHVQICSCSLLPDLKASCTASRGKIDP